MTITTLEPLELPMPEPEDEDKISDHPGYDEHLKAAPESNINPEEIPF